MCALGGKLKVTNVFVLCVLFLLISLGELTGFEKVVLWGHKLHSSTHSYIHNAFYRAFEHLGYPTYWFDDHDDVSNFDFSNSLFITEGNVDKNIPLRNDCDYILHYCTPSKYAKQFKAGRCINLCVFTNERTIHSGNENIVYFDKGIYRDLQSRSIYMPWATDLLPHEIDKIKDEVPSFFKKGSREIYWVGTTWTGIYGNNNELHAFRKACEEKNVKFITLSFLADPKLKGVSVERNIELIQKSFIAPTIVGSWQKETGMIPCRIFKNISYGQMGATNSETIYEFFDKKIVYNPDPYQLFFDAEKRLETFTLEDLYELMDLVKTKHTYLNRIDTLLTFLEVVKNL